MQNYEKETYPVFDLFESKWSLVTAGEPDHFNTCVVSWGLMGNLWGHAGKNRSIVNVFVHPSRYTSEFLKQYDTFTVSFYPREYKKAMGYLGSHSGRDGDKITPSGLTPIFTEEGITFKEAEFTFFCKKQYMQKFDKELLSQEIQDFYAHYPKVYPKVSEDGTADLWEPHYSIIGEVIRVEDKRAE